MNDFRSFPLQFSSAPNSWSSKFFENIASFTLSFSVWSDCGLRPGYNNVVSACGKHRGGLSLRPVASVELVPGCGLRHETPHMSFTPQTADWDHFYTCRRLRPLSIFNVPQVQTFSLCWSRFEKENVMSDLA